MEAAHFEMAIFINCDPFSPMVHLNHACMNHKILKLLQQIVSSVLQTFKLNWIYVLIKISRNIVVGMSTKLLPSFLQEFCNNKRGKCGYLELNLLLKDLLLKEN